MARKFDYSAVVLTVLRILAEKPNRYWTKLRLIEEVRRYISTSNTSRIATIILTMHEVGLICGVGRLRGEPGRFGHKTSRDQQDGSDERTHNRTQEQWRLQIERMKASVAELQHQIGVSKKQAETAEKERDKAREEVKKASMNVVEVRIKKPGTKKAKVMKDLFHAQFRRVLKLAQARKNIFVYGPTGCGKSHLCEQVATALGLPFAFVSCTSGMSEGVLGGRLLPTGRNGQFNYGVSEFIKCYENGGVFLLDEIDAADSNVLLFINAALANGQVAVSNRPKKPYAKRHADFVCTAAANTVGTGADRLYSGRNKLDAASLDRFHIGKVAMDYDERVETILCPDDELRALLLRYRKAVDAHRLERAISTRFMRDAHEMLYPKDYGRDHEPFTMEEVEEALFMGWREDEVNKVKSYTP